MRCRFSALRSLRAGFAMPVADTEKITVTYPGALVLMRDLRACGCRRAAAPCCAVRPWRARHCSTPSASAFPTAAYPRPSRSCSSPDGRRKPAGETPTDPEDLSTRRYRSSGGIRSVGAEDCRRCSMPASSQ
jgi:hypothetical protein